MKTFDEAIQHVLVVNTMRDVQRVHAKEMANFKGLQSDILNSEVYRIWVEAMCENLTDQDGAVTVTLASAISSGFLSGVRIGMEMERTELTPAPADPVISAARELYEALKAIEAGFQDGSIRFTKRRSSDDDPYHPANSLMCSALAKAESRD